MADLSEAFNLNSIPVKKKVNTRRNNPINLVCPECKSDAYSKLLHNVILNDGGSTAAYCSKCKKRFKGIDRSYV